MGEPRLPSQAYLHEYFDYNPATGTLTRLVRPRKHFSSNRVWNTWNTRWAGKSANHLKMDGRVLVRVDGQSFFASRVIYKWMTGQDPLALVDHKDRDQSNNRWKNLRPATRAQNQQNRKRLSHNTTGFKGVSYLRRRARFIARIKVKGHTIRSKHFRTAEEAFAAYCEMGRHYFGEFFYDGQ